MNVHSLAASIKTIHWGHLDASLKPQLTVESGDSIEIETFSGSRSDWGGNLSLLSPRHREIIETITPQLGPHILTGPIAVRDAEPGDILEVRILSIELSTDWGYNLMRPGGGILTNECNKPEQRVLNIDRKAMTTTLPWGPTIPLDPFFGVIAVAPPVEQGRISSVPPGSFGGNIDNKELRAGSCLFLPIFNPGALFSTGDGHAVQGDGEMDVTALETCLNGKFQLVLHKASQLKSPIRAPRALTKTHYITMGLDPDLNNAAAMASSAMLDWLIEIKGWQRQEAYVFASLACDLHITQAVNRTKGVHGLVRRELID